MLGREGVNIAVTMRLAIIETSDKARVLLELSEEDFLRKLEEAYAKTGDLKKAFELVAKYLRELSIKL